LFSIFGKQVAFLLCQFSLLIVLFVEVHSAGVDYIFWVQKTNNNYLTKAKYLDIWLLLIIFAIVEIEFF